MPVVIPVESLRRSPSAVLFEGGDVPAGTPHALAGAGDDTLRVVSIHPSRTTEQTTWLDA
jgi:hypothetical protein